MVRKLIALLFLIALASAASTTVSQFKITAKDAGKSTINTEVSKYLPTESIDITYNTLVKFNDQTSVGITESEKFLYSMVPTTNNQMVVSVFRKHTNGKGELIMRFTIEDDAPSVNMVATNAYPANKACDIAARWTSDAFTIVNQDTIDKTIVGEDFEAAYTKATEGKISNAATKITNLKIELVNKANNDPVDPAAPALLLFPKGNIDDIKLNEFFVHPQETSKHERVIYKVEVSDKDEIELTVVTGGDMTGTDNVDINDNTVMSITVKKGVTTAVPISVGYGQHLTLDAKVTFTVVDAPTKTLMPWNNPAIGLEKLDLKFDAKYVDLASSFTASEITDLKIELFENANANAATTDSSKVKQASILPNEIKNVQLNKFFSVPKDTHSHENVIYKIEVFNDYEITLTAVTNKDVDQTKKIIQTSAATTFRFALENGVKKPLTTDVLGAQIKVTFTVDNAKRLIGQDAASELKDLGAEFDTKYSELRTNLGNKDNKDMSEFNLARYSDSQCKDGEEPVITKGKVELQMYLHHEKTDRLYFFTCDSENQLTAHYWEQDDDKTNTHVVKSMTVSEGKNEGCKPIGDNKFVKFTWKGACTEATNSGLQDAEKTLTELKEKIFSLFESEEKNAELTALKNKEFLDSLKNYKKMEVAPKKKPEEKDTGLSGGAIAGIVIGSLVGVALIGGLVWYFCNKKN